MTVKFNNEELAMFLALSNAFDNYLKASEIQLLLLVEKALNNLSSSSDNKLQKTLSLMEELKKDIEVLCHKNNSSKQKLAGLVAFKARLRELANIGTIPIPSDVIAKLG